MKTQLEERIDLARGDKITKQDWIEAGNAARDINLAAVERVIGLPIPKKINDFEDLCAFVFLAISGEKLPRCNLRGRGFRSQWHAAKVADVWPENNKVAAREETFETWNTDRITATPAVEAVQPLKPELDDVQTITPNYTVGLDAGGKTWNVSDQFCVLWAGCTRQVDAERLKNAAVVLYMERQETIRFAAQRTELLAALKAVIPKLMTRAKANPENYCYKWRIEPLEPCGCDICVIRAAIAKATGA